MQLFFRDVNTQHKYYPNTNTFIQQYVAGV